MTHRFAHGAWKTLLVSAAAAALVWGLSPWITGHWEPWDADGIYYLAALLVAGAVAGLLSPKPLWAHYLGAFIGQLSYEVFVIGAGPLLALGLIFLLGYTVVFAVGAAIAVQARKRLGHVATPNNKS